MKKNLAIPAILLLCLLQQLSQAQTLHKYSDSIVLSNGFATVVFHTATGRLDYHFSNGARIDNTVAYMNDIHLGRMTTADYISHTYSTEKISDSLGKGIRLTIKHTDDGKPFWLLQQVTIYKQSYITALLKAGTAADQGALPETRDISPLAILPSQKGQLFMPGEEPRILDEPFDNDNWVGVVERHWPDANGISYEFSSIYDNNNLSGLVIGSLKHDFWKTGLTYNTASVKGVLDSFVVFGGVATRDNPSLPRFYGGRDGTHDYVPHGTMTGAAVFSPLVFISSADNINDAFKSYGECNVHLNGSLAWKGYAPVYWNSFGVEGTLGSSKIMMPQGVEQTSDFIHALDNLSKYGKPVLSIDSYDQSIYTTEQLNALGNYGKRSGQELGFYFCPFSLWSWKSAVNQVKVPGTEISLSDAILKDEHNNPIPYKDGDWGAYPLDPTHPTTRLFIINQLQKAKAVGAKFIKIDFLPCGTLEAAKHYDPTIRTGMQAYDWGMKMVKHLIDSIVGPDIFLTEAISPMFPNQYAHTRFNSTDVYSHLRDDEPGFPNWGSTEASLATGSHLTWVQGTLYPFTNMDVTIMKAFQKNPDLSEGEIKVRFYALMVMGSILGDGSDYRQPLAAERAKKFLNNPAFCAFFSHPVAFTPLQFADGDSFDQQMTFFLKPGLYTADPVNANTTHTPAPALLALFNFSGKTAYNKTFDLKNMGLPDRAYAIQDFMTDQPLGNISKGQQTFSLTVPLKDALMVKLVPEQ